MNIFSITNAGKRQYGENHWFWAVWIAVEQTIDLTPEDERRFRPYLGWNGTNPTASGFCPSKKAARRAALSAMKPLSPNIPGAYERGWAWHLLFEEHAKDNRPRFSRCKAGKNKWLWVVYQSFPFEDEEPIAHGIADTPELALEDAEVACGPVSHSGNHLAESFRKKQAALKRINKVTHASDASSMEFVYECHPDNSVTIYRIVKKTKKRIYVETRPYSEDRRQSGTWWDYSQTTFVLDRLEFEATGKATRSCRSWRDTFYSDPEVYYAERRSWVHRPECLVGLGVPAGASIREIKAAYRRLAIKTHPDKGGDPKEFMQVKTWYEQAMALAQ